jgi:hypothetical protein
MFIGKDIRAGRWGITLIQNDGEPVTFSWWQIYSVEHKEKEE